MRLGLRGRLALAQVALIAALGLAVAFLAGRATEDRLEAQMRDRLTRECGLLRLAIEGAVGWPPTGMARLEATVRDFASAAGVRAVVLAPDGRVLAQSEADEGGTEPHMGRPEIVEARARGVGSSVRHSPTTGVRTMYVATSGGAGEPTVRLALSLAEVRRSAGAVRRATYAGTLVATLLAALIAVWSVRAMTGSLSDLVQVARRLGRGELGARAWTDTADETRELGEALNAMATDLHGAIEDLRSTAARLEAVLSQIAEGVLVVADDGTLALMNPKAGELLGVDPSAARGRLVSETVPQPELADLVARAARLGTVISQEPVAIGATQRTVAPVAAPLRAGIGGAKGVVVTLRDLTEVQRLLRVRQEFVANASHELRTPVAAIHSLAEILEGGAIEEPAEAKRFVARIAENTRRLTNLLDDMLALARLDERVGGTAPRNVCSVPGMLRSAVTRLEPQAVRKGIALTFDAPARLNAHCSEQHVVAALVNLVDNAVKFTPEGGRVAVTAEAHGAGSVRIRVADTGPGIPERARERVFERFYRVDRGRSRELGGTGLGLSIVKHAVEQSGGGVWVEPGPSGGASFVIELPAASAEAP